MVFLKMPEVFRMHTEKYHMVLVAYRLTDDVTSDVHAGVRELMDYGVRRMYSASGKDGRLYSGRDTTYTTRATRLTIVTPRKLMMKVSVPKEEYLLKKNHQKYYLRETYNCYSFVYWC